MTLTPIMLALALGATQAQAPHPPTPPGAHGGPHMGAGEGLHAHLFPPELIMGHQAEIALTTKQRKQLVSEIQQTQGKIVELQFELKAAESELIGLVETERVDEQRALAQSDKLMALESQIKRNHLRLLLRIRNILTPDQRDKLSALKQHQRRPPSPPGAPGPRR